MSNLSNCQKRKLAARIEAWEKAGQSYQHGNRKPGSEKK